MCLEILKRTARDPVNPHATPKAHSLLKYLHSVAGKQIITGQHTQTNPMEERTYIYEVTGYYPRLQGFELLSYSPNINYEDASEECLIEISENKHTVDTALSWAKATGGIVSLCFHWFSPIGGRDKSFYTQNTDFDPCQIFITGSKEHLAFYHDLDELSKQLKRFQDADIPVLFRPLHEAEGNWFWWGSKGADVAARLYQLIYDYYVTEKQLNNLLWVWSCPTREGYPGDEYVDVISWDIYTTPHAVTDYESQYKKLIANTSCFKVAALTEVGVIPDVDMLIKSHVPWAYYMTWSKEFCLTEEYNTKAALRKMYASPYSIKLECE
ncbi:MAG: beta-mannosidase [Lachnospiraceae bacterium]|nr:beta-mannosidase [Lachnospiraceae bacterium]